MPFLVMPTLKYVWGRRAEQIVLGVRGWDLTFFKVVLASARRNACAWAPDLPSSSIVSFGTVRYDTRYRYGITIIEWLQISLQSANYKETTNDYN